MPTNYVLLEKITVGATAVATVAFSGIPQTGYTDLVVKASIRSSRSSTNDAFYVYFNTDTTAANYKLKLLYGTGAAANSYTSSTYNDSTGWISGNSTTASTFSNSEFYIPNYTSANAKSVSYDSVGENNATDAHMGITASSWSGTAAINKITIGSANGANFMQYSTFYLYGVAKLGTTPAIVPYATGGDTIMTDGTYWYHAFKSSGTFTPTKGLSCDVLVVAGGGGGGGEIPGGGGAGGLRYGSALSVSTATTVTVGAGGAGSLGSAGTDIGASGSNSVFSTITSAGGGGGGGASNNGAAGGSGGGGWIGGTANGGAGNTPSTSPVQGYAGGGGANQTYGIGGGGGGAGGAGANGGTTNGTSGTGGIGVNTYSTWATVTGTGVSGYYAGGGGGGTWNAGGEYTATSGGAGGGGGGWGGTASPGTGTAGTANTGGGGGGGGNSSSSIGGNGGSGIVIVRYAV